jgi:diguanylate cyclase (GGDEF)-like protein
MNALAEASFFKVCYKVCMTEDAPENHIQPPAYHGPVTAEQYLAAKDMDPGETALWKLRAERAEAELARLGVDPLTGLLKGDNFMHQVKNRLSRLESLRQSVLMYHFDIKGLKIANDTNGHAAGDEVLRNSANLIKDFARLDVGDLAGRLHDNGDELALAIFFSPEQVSPDEVQASLDERIMDKVKDAVAAGEVSGLRWNSALYSFGMTTEQLLHESDPVEELHPGKVKEFPSVEVLPGRNDRQPIVS